MPENPGVYIFRDQRGRPLYIGRATVLKDRVKSYFGLDLIETRGPRIVDMVTKAKTLTWQETDSVLEAIILESNLIKKYQPFYNVDERDDKSSLYVVITEEEWPRVYLERARDFEQKLKDGKVKPRAYFGPFTHTGLIKESLKIIRKIFPFRDKKAHDLRHANFYQALGMSPDMAKSNSHEQYERTIKYLVLFFEGRKNEIFREVEKQMKEEVKSMQFEKAQVSKKLFFALKHINDTSLIKRDLNGQIANGFRIEAYDIAHLSGLATVGVMTVSVGGQFKPSEYRKFKISKEQINDPDSLKEVIERRFNHPEWTFPDLIVVDGNEIQMNVAESVLKARRINISVVAVTKDERHKAAKILGDPILVKKYKQEIIALNGEAHRFAIRYHREKRKIV